MQFLTSDDLKELEKWSVVGPQNMSTTLHKQMDIWGISERYFENNYTLEEILHIINETAKQKHWFKAGTEAFLVTAYTLIIVVGVLLNSIICYIVIRKKSLRTSRNMFIINLCVSDLIMCLFCMPFTLVQLLLKDWMLGDALCRLVPWLQATNVFASIITMTAIALDRYHVIMYPCVVKEHTKLWGAFSCILLIWISSASIGTPLLVFTQTMKETYFVDISFTFCMEMWPNRGSLVAYTTVVIILQFLLPILLLICLHWRISNFLKYRINRDPHTQGELNRAMKEAKRHKKNTTLLMSIAMMYAICWFPLTLLNFLADFDYNLFMYQDFLLVFASTHLIAMTSAIANPIMYGWFNTNFKREFTKFVCFWRRDDQQPSDENNQAMMDSETRRLFKLGSARVTYKKATSYKAIQTESEPKADKNGVTPVLQRASTEELRINSDPSVHQLE